MELSNNKNYNKDLFIFIRMEKTIIHNINLGTDREQLQPS